MSRSACSRMTFLPARWPPGCSLVCCGQQMTAPLPNASKPLTRISRKLPPYAISRVTVAIPHTMPSMVSALRVWLRRSALQASFRICSIMPMLAACLVAQGFDGIDGGGAARRIQGGQDGDAPEDRQGHRPRLPCWQQPGEEVRHRQQVDQRTEAESDEQTGAAADQRNNQRFQEELPHNAVRRSSQGFADSDFACALANGHQHHVHDPEAAEEQSYEADRAEKILHAIRHGAEGLCLLN